MLQVLCGWRACRPPLRRISLCGFAAARQQGTFMGETKVEMHTVAWKRHDFPGHEACRVLWRDTGWAVVGVAVLVYERQACRLDYVIDCDPQWVTRSAGITGWVGDQTIDITVGQDAGGRWRLNGCSVEGVAGCSDIDLHFSPLCIKVSMDADDLTPTQPNNVHSRVHIVFSVNRRSTISPLHNGGGIPGIA